MYSSLIDNVAHFNDACDSQLRLEYASGVLTLEEIMNKSPRIAAECLQRNGMLLGLVEQQTNIIKRAALINNGYSIIHVKVPLPCDRYLAVMTNGVLGEIAEKDQSELCCSISVTNHPETINMIKNRRMLMKILLNYPSFIVYANLDHDEKVIFYQRYPRLYDLEKDKTEELNLQVVGVHGLAVGFIENPSPDVVETALRNTGLSITALPEQYHTEEAQKLVVSHNGSYIKYLTGYSQAVLRLAEANGHNKYDTRDYVSEYITAYYNNLPFVDYTPIDGEKFYDEYIVNVLNRRVADIFNDIDESNLQDYIGQPQIMYPPYSFILRSNIGQIISRSGRSSNSLTPVTSGAQQSPSYDQILSDNRNRQLVRLSNVLPDIAATNSDEEIYRSMIGTDTSDSDSDVDYFSLDNVSLDDVIGDNLAELRVNETNLSSYCSICMSDKNNMGYALKPCLHSAMCFTCIESMKQDTCPFCREKIEKVERLTEKAYKVLQE